MKFENGIFFCEECEGTGKLLISSDLDAYNWKFCDTCRGIGKVTWIENIFGVRRLSVSENRCKEHYRDGKGWFSEDFKPVVRYKGDPSLLKKGISMSNWID